MSDGTLNPINFVTGTLGSGKSGYATRTAFQYLAAGKFVALNYDLQAFRGKDKEGLYDPSHPDDGKPWWVSVRDLRYRQLSKRSSAPTGPDRWREYEDITSKCLRFDGLEDLWDYRLPGDSEKEDRGLLIVDEGALRANSRMWAERKAGNKSKGHHALSDLQFMLHIRKLGWTMLFLTQGFKMIDNQYRDLGPVEIKLRNFSKMTIPVLNVKFSSKPRFMAIHYMRENDFIMRREYYGIGPSFGHYRSAAVFHPDDEVEGGVRQMEYLPPGKWASSPPDPPYKPPARTAGAVLDAQERATPTARARSLVGRLIGLPPRVPPSRSSS